MKGAIIGILIFALVTLQLAGCAAPARDDSISELEAVDESEPVDEPEAAEGESEVATPDEKDDIAAIEQVMQEYFEAFSTYDTERIGSLIAEETRETEGTEILMAVVFAQGLNLKFELTKVVVSIDGDSATAVVTGTSSLGSGPETYNLVREGGDWKIHSKVKETEGSPEPEAEPADEPEPEPEPTPPTPTTGYSRSSPASIGTELFIEEDDWGDIYKLNITLMEIVRGAEAWSRIEEANMFNDPAPSGFEYVLVRIRFEYLEGPTADTSYDISPVWFTVVSSEGREQEYESVVSSEPNLRASLYPGATHEGWNAYLVEEQDDKPLITFGRDYKGRGGVWWQLY